MMAEGYSGARYMSNKFVTNLYGWQVTRPSAVSDALWNRVYNTYYNDRYNIGVTDWLKTGNNAYSLISMSGTMLTAIQEGYWNANDATIRNIANTWAQATVQNGVACCDCSCGNIAMMQWAVQYVNPDILAQLLPKLYEATRNPVFTNNTQSTVPPETQDNVQNQNEASTNNPVEGSTSSATIATNSSSTTNQATAQNGENAQGEAFSNVGAGSESVQAGSSSVEGADVKKSVEINPITSQSASEVGLSLIAVIAILCLIMVIAFGYFRDSDDKDKKHDLDKLFREKF
jgi:cobaltochelatase CobN